jgi:hypothetical protein
MHYLATSAAFETSSLPTCQVNGTRSIGRDARKVPSRVRERRMIVATLADYATREISVEIDVDPERPFAVPAAIAGRFFDVPTTDRILEMKDQPVAVDGRRYRFARIHKNGSFKLRKGW